jgi:hypothetical protein
MFDQVEREQIFPQFGTIFDPMPTRRVFQRFPDTFDAPMPWAIPF